MSATQTGARGYDVVIVGAGIIACTFARLLIDRGLRVVMIDAGAQHSLRAGENLKNFRNYQDDVDQFGGIVRGLMHPVSIPTGGQAFIRHALNPRQDGALNLPGAVAAYAVGGMAVHWTCAIPRQHPTIERADVLPSDEWDGLYTEAETLLDRHTDVYDGSSRHAVIKRVLREAGWAAENTPLAARRLSAEYVRYAGADTVLGELAEPGNRRLDILREHRVTRLEHEGGRVRAVLVRDLRNKEDIRISGEAFVVAAGWVHTAQILWTSDIHCDEGSALGRFLTDHSFTACQIVLDPELVEQIGEHARARGTRPDSGPHPLPIPMDDPPPHMFIPVAEHRPWHAMVFREAFQFDPLTPAVDSRLIVDLKWFGMIEPGPENRMVFARDLHDRLGMPQPTFEFRLGRGDEEREIEMFGDMQRVALHLGESLPASPPRRIPLGASTHTMGATRMGRSDDGTSVVDPNSKVWGMDNLYVGGNCVLPTANACNPTLTSVALAIKAARHLSAGRRSSSPA